MKKKILIGIIVFIFLILVMGLIYISPNRRLHSLEKYISNISLPENIEKIAIKSAIGDSGGNGDYSTLRVVMVVKTELSINELEETLENMNLCFPKDYERTISYVTHCDSIVFESSRAFKLSFDEMQDVSDFRNYYYIEFVE